MKTVPRCEGKDTLEPLLEVIRLLCAATDQTEVNKEEATESISVDSETDVPSNTTAETETMAGNIGTTPTPNTIAAAEQAASAGIEIGVFRTAMVLTTFSVFAI